MNQFIEPVRALPGDDGGVPSTATAVCSSNESLPRDERAVARQLCCAIDRAVELGLWEHAEQVIQTAARLAQAHPRLSERIARFRLQQNHIDAALTVIESCQGHSASLRLLRAVCLIKLGRGREAHMDLHEWCRRPTAPLQARCMLALLEWQAGDMNAAAEALRQNLTQLEDPHTLTLLILLCVQQNKFEQAELWAQRLRQTSAFSDNNAETDILLRSLGMDGIHDDIKPTAQQIEMLAAELLANEDVIPALVVAQMHEPHPHQIQLQRASLECVLPELGDQVAAYVALVQLCRLMNDMDAAMHWAQRGLEQHPLSASLARLVVECEDELSQQRIEHSTRSMCEHVEDGSDRALSQVVREQAA